MALVRVADYIAQCLARHGVRHVFMVTGGGAMHLNDAFGRCKELTYVACHHEQACAMAAESYFRLTNRLAAVNVTTGPGGTNAITGVYGAWVDSLAMIVISGQTKWETTVRSTGLPLRQLGDQEIDIVAMVSSITKYARMVTDPESIRYHLEKALYLATSGRPGPVWLDIPMNVQGARVEAERLSGYTPRPEDDAGPEGAPQTGAALGVTCRALLNRLREAERPVILAGSGVRLAGAHEPFLRLVERLRVPVTTAWNAHDLVEDDHPCYVGRPGTVGDRAGNFAVQNADYLLVLGSRLNIRQIGYDWRSFARAAHKAMIDIDAAELRKPTLSIDMPVHAHLGEALASLLACDYGEPPRPHGEYLRWCRERRARYPTVLASYWSSDRVNPYCFVAALWGELSQGERVVTGDGTACVVTFQAATIRRHQRLYTNSGCAAMGYDLPAAIGASFAADRARVVCIAGDGSLQMNVQELQTLATHRLPIKIFVLNNQGYHSIRQTQTSYFPDNLVGCDAASGIGFPDFGKLAAAYELPYFRIAHHKELSSVIGATLAGDGPGLCEVVLDAEQGFAPKLASRALPDGRMVSSPLEDMAPFLSRDELASNMLIPILTQG